MLGAARSSRISKSYLKRVEARGANLEAVEFDRVTIDVLVVDEGTTFGHSLPDVGTVIVDENPESRNALVGAAASEWLLRHQVRPKATLPVEDPSTLPLVAFFDRVWHKARRQTYFKPKSDDSAGRLLRDPMWEILKPILLQHRRLSVVEGKPTAGTSSTMFHITIPRGASLETDPVRREVVKAAQGLT